MAGCDTRWLWGRVDDGVDQLGRRPSDGCKRRSAGEEEVEESAQTVNVGSRRDGCALDLFGTSRFGGQETIHSLVDRCVATGIEELGDTEIEKLGKCPLESPRHSRV